MCNILLNFWSVSLEVLIWRGLMQQFSCTSLQFRNGTVWLGMVKYWGAALFAIGSSLSWNLYGVIIFVMFLLLPNEFSHRDNKVVPVQKLHESYPCITPTGMWRLDEAVTKRRKWGNRNQCATHLRDQWLHTVLAKCPKDLTCRWSFRGGTVFPFSVLFSVQLCVITLTLSTQVTQIVLLSLGQVKFNCWGD